MIDGCDFNTIDMTDPERRCPQSTLSRGFSARLIIWVRRVIDGR
jgi:hypothetical protein